MNRASALQTVTKSSYLVVICPYMYIYQHRGVIQSAWWEVSTHLGWTAWRSIKIQLHLHAYIYTGAAGKSAHRRLQIWTPQVHRFHNGRMLLHLSPHMNPYIVILNVEFTVYGFICGDKCQSIRPLLMPCTCGVHIWSLLWADLPAAPVCMYAWRCSWIFIEHHAVQPKWVDTSHQADFITPLCWYMYI